MPDRECLLAAIDGLHQQWSSPDFYKVLPDADADQQTDIKLVETLVRLTYRFAGKPMHGGGEGCPDLWAGGLSACEQAIRVLHERGLVQFVSGGQTANWTDEGRRMLESSD